MINYFKYETDQEMYDDVLPKFADILQISVDELVDRYIRRSIYNDYFKEPDTTSIQEYDETVKRRLKEFRDKGCIYRE